MKWALIVGASGDIGQAVAEQLASAGWSLYLHYFNSQKKISNTRNRLTELYPKQDFLTLQADFTNERAAEQLSANLFAVDAVIFAQGTTSYGLFQQQDPDALKKMLQMQVIVPTRLLQLLETKLAANHFGRIVFVGSVYGGSGSAMEVGYSTVKGALTAFSAAYSKEVASLGVTVNVIAPGAVATRMNQFFSTEEKAAVAADIPLGRFAQSTEIAYWIKALLAQAAGYLTGQTIYVTGGWLK
ncbi:elongation factor P 5-aminopentanone reductase [Liquorilactobacillus nagelii]|uniref:elongation factor P 5-aminopentanone reductase n=1 Tax=Liquorilactobacillus nagelii TaxID=82688 RepID=UPI0006EF38B8|nr:SDR family oxidoreductase [Liquorilactobacillus nagelii]KRL40548.1 3-oxoacyl-[acyl-carrier-protein] reductase [Liquorilactobacillus nagelii DSM 13675]QYH54478.1 SDR family oxidoreductase [Liquorilactobacillus nagelii DSM 13675]